MTRIRIRPQWAWLLALAIASHATAGSVRVSELVDVHNVRSNQLTGIGVVVGLNQSGDQSKVTRQILASYYSHLGGISVDARDLNPKNSALVSVSATLPPYARNGSEIDVLVSAEMDATSLFGGELLVTELKGQDNEVYAIARGPVSVGGFITAGQAASVQKNHPTVGRIPNGATVEREVPMRPVSASGTVDLVLRHAGFANAFRVADAVNTKFRGTAAAIDGGTIRIRVPDEFAKERSTDFIQQLLGLSVEPEEVARVVINDRTGTVVAGEHVVIDTVIITHGNLSFTVSESPIVSQPAPLSDGKTEVVPRTEVTANEEQKALVVVPGGVTVKEVAEALNALGVSPRDLSQIFQALKVAGALHAELVIM
ncbi:MAG: flagellar basal body P-ring protein FlgI [Planctomycetes bacterium]|nr:flagellar basal body P-ring protein FlgI [Planctomycetota bacterium]MBI3843036.1 flagellar basal body P-ring protein FlgI [Planctomycetota bacterium]